MFLTFSKNPRWYTKKKGNQDPKILVLVMYIVLGYRGFVYELVIYVYSD